MGSVAIHSHGESEVLRGVVPSAPRSHSWRRHLKQLPSKGRIAAGCDADFVAFNPDASFVVRGSELLHRHPLTPYDGRTLTGVVSRVWLGGSEVAPDGEPRGRLLRRGGGTL